jgi:hypothetical protein
VAELCEVFGETSVVKVDNEHEVYEATHTWRENGKVCY